MRDPARALVLAAKALDRLGPVTARTPLAPDDPVRRYLRAYAEWIAEGAPPIAFSGATIGAE